MPGLAAFDPDGFAHAWAEAWNRRDVVAVLGHFADDARFTSPRAALIVGQPQLVGKDALRTYWLAAAQRLGETRFEPEATVWDAGRRRLCVLYTRVTSDRHERACEILRFDTSGLVTEGEALYGASV